jgi:hypothetical protein
LNSFELRELLNASKRLPDMTLYKISHVNGSLDKKILNFQKHPILFRLAFKKFLFEKKKEIPSNFFNFAI